MKVLIKKNVLESIVTNINPYLEKRDLSSINSHILFKTENGVLSVKGTDHEIGLAYKVSNNIQISEDGEATANGKKLLDIIKGLKDGDVILETVEKYLYIKQNNSKYKLPMQNAAEFPTFPSTSGKAKFEINAGILGKSLKKISPCIELNNTKRELTGALLDIKTDMINLVGTDTKRLGVYTIPLTSDREFNVIIPKKAILEMQKLFFEDIGIYYDENIFIAVSENFEFFTKLINNFYRIIPRINK
jgi:DNA polymerase-3 subunit beta